MCVCVCVCVWYLDYISGFTTIENPLDLGGHICLQTDHDLLPGTLRVCTSPFIDYGGGISLIRMRYTTYLDKQFLVFRGGGQLFFFGHD